MTTGSDEVERVLSYLTSQGERYTFAEIWVRFAKARLELIDSVSEVDQGQADFRPDAGEWSISEVLSHLVTSSGTVSEIVDALSRGVTPTPGRIDPPREETSLDINELRERLTLDSLRWSALVERLPPAPSTDLTAPHPFFGELHARAWLLFQRIHDIDHAGQVEKNKVAGTGGADGKCDTQ